MNIWKCKRCEVIFTDENKVCGCEESPSPWELIGKTIKEEESLIEQEYEYKITIDDSLCAWEFKIPCDGERSIQEIAELVHCYLDSKSPLRGKYVEGSGEV